MFASASQKTMDTVVQAGLAPTSTVFAINTMAIATPTSPTTPVSSLADLANPAVKVAVCAADVPCGTAADKLFENNKLTVNPVTREVDVKAVLSKVQLGEVDAGIVYVTDVKAAGDALVGIDIPARAERDDQLPDHRAVRQRRTRRPRRLSWPTSCPPTRRRCCSKPGSPLRDVTSRAVVDGAALARPRPCGARGPLPRPASARAPDPGTVEQVLGGAHLADVVVGAAPVARHRYRLDRRRRDPRGAARVAARALHGARAAVPARPRHGAARAATGGRGNRAAAGIRTPRHRGAAARGAHRHHASRSPRRASSSPRCSWPCRSSSSRSRERCAASTGSSRRPPSTLGASRIEVFRRVTCPWSRRRWWPVPC